MGCGKRGVLTICPECHTEGPFDFVHDPTAAAAGRQTFAGHIHPAIVLRGGGDSLRLPCFHLKPGLCVLPAFSAFTSGASIRPDIGDRVLAIPRTTKSSKSSGRHVVAGAIRHPMNAVAARLAPFGTTIFTEMTRLAVEHNAVNLAQGFPDFDGPEFLKHAAIEAINAWRNQYARMTGDPVLNTAIAADWRKRAGVSLDPDKQVTVTPGCTEAIAATMLGILTGQGRFFSPFYHSHRAFRSPAPPRFMCRSAPRPASSPVRSVRDRSYSTTPNSA